jgi:hypothetical protein
MGPPEPPDPPDDALADLRERLRATQEAASRLAEDPPRVPPQGWATPPREDAAGEGAGQRSDELAALVALVGALRDLVPAELQQQVNDLIRQVLLLVRAVLDLWIEHLEPGRGAEPEVEDIPVL